MKKNFVFFSIATHLGGAEKSLLSFLKEFRKEQNTLVVVPKGKGPLLDELSQLDIPYLVVPLPALVLSLSRQRPVKSFVLALPCLFILPVYIRHINQILKEKKWNGVHSTGLKFHLILCLLSLFNKSVHIHIHIRDIIKFYPIQLFFSLFKSRKNLHFIFNSNVTKNTLYSLKGPVIYNGFDDKTFFPSPSHLKNSLGLSATTPLIGVVGAIARWKGQREFLQMAKNLLTKNPSYHFVIVGDEIYDTYAETGELSYLKNWVEKENLKENIHFLSFKKDIAEVYRGLDLLVHTSIQPEPFGRVLVEAMFCGCPILASDQGGPLEIIEHKKNGWLYRQGNVQEMTKQAAFLLEQNELRKSLSINALEIKSRFSLQQSYLALSKFLSSEGLPPH